MPILIDGHNLIPKIPGLHLSDFDDEMRLIEMLQTYTRLRRKGQIECYFDKAAMGDWPNKRRFGQVQVQFARHGSSADARIEARLARLGRRARNWLVVSSDQRVRQAARSAGARSQTSDEFAEELLAAIEAGEGPSEISEESPPISPQDVDYWLSQFSQGNAKDE
jgi:predicted RNA-binding protein with PIN domain